MGSGYKNRNSQSQRVPAFLSANQEKHRCHREDENFEWNLHFYQEEEEEEEEEKEWVGIRVGDDMIEVDDVCAPLSPLFCCRRLVPGRPVVRLPPLPITPSPHHVGDTLKPLREAQRGGKGSTAGGKTFSFWGLEGCAELYPWTVDPCRCCLLLTPSEVLPTGLGSDMSRRQGQVYGGAVTQQVLPRRYAGNNTAAPSFPRP
ncbi:hypothetical protein O3P69_014504 [Scylla paramamosain]|uniref:Uncharacterized protein n=1 Tax=Scylla paramamosain TaxID=85552 RepID=A0AAW0TDM5_SCYPA